MHLYNPMSTLLNGSIIAISIHLKALNRVIHYDPTYLYWAVKFYLDWSTKKLREEWSKE